MIEELTPQDVRRLASDSSGAARAAVAAKVAATLDRPELSEGERRIAEEILRRLAVDAELRVRRALAEHVKTSRSLPPEVARTLARDVEAVATPILELCSALGDDDLIEAVRTGTLGKQVAVARRPALSAGLAETIAGLGAEEAVAALMGNAGADVTERALGTALDRFGDSERVHDPMCRRARLPAAIAERLVTLVSDRLRDHLVVHHELPVALATDLVLRSRERATVALVEGGTDAVDLDRLVQQLHRNGRLTASLVVRALCMGDLAFFEAALAHLADVPLGNARLLIHDAGPLGLKSIYEKADLPLRMLPAVRVALEVVRETDFDGGVRDRERYRRRILERLLTRHDHLAPEDVEYLLERLDALESPQA